MSTVVINSSIKVFFVLILKCTLYKYLPVLFFVLHASVIILFDIFYCSSANDRLLNTCRHMSVIVCLCAFVFRFIAISFFDILTCLSEFQTERRRQCNIRVLMSDRVPIMYLSSIPL